MTMRHTLITAATLALTASTIATVAHMEQAAPRPEPVRWSLERDTAALERITVATGLTLSDCAAAAQRLALTASTDTIDADAGSTINILCVPEMEPRP